MEYVRIGIVDDPHKDRRALLAWEPRQPPKEPARPHVRFQERHADGDDGRLVREFRREAARRDPAHLMAMAVFLWDRDREHGEIFADLAATGRVARSRLSGVSGLDVAERARHAFGQVPDLQRKVDQIMAHSQAVEAYLDKPEWARRQDPIALRGGETRYLAVCSDEDVPWRPVNVESSNAVQLDLEVPLPSRTVTTRLVVVGEPAEAKGWVLYAHGGASRAEECEAVAQALRVLPDGRDIVVVSPDLPGCGFGERVPCEEVGLDPKKRLPRNAEEHGPFPFLDHLDDFLGALVPAVRAGIPELDGKPLLAMCGGSLGGNLSLRAAWKGQLPARRYVAWSPASIWDPLDDPIGLKNMGPEVAYRMASDSELDPANRPEESSRRKYFFSTFEKNIPFTPKSADMWWDAHWPHREAWRAAARADRTEVYDELHRCYTWRYSYEQLFFSWQQEEAGVRRRLAIPKERPICLLAGTGDNFHFSHIFDRVQAVGLLREEMPAAERVVLMGRTGHSIHDERPRLLARELLAAIQVASGTS
ncbi:MAG: alpha/beta fold hydrolase [Myxococcota bacterium]